MAELSELAAPQPAPPAASAATGVSGRRAWQRFAVVVVLLALGFARPLWDWVLFALESETFSYVLLVPFISGYLAWLNRATLAQEVGPPSWGALGPALAGLAALGWWLFIRTSLCSLNDYLTWTLLAFACFVLAGGYACLGHRFMKAAAFPAFFLLGMAPFPEGLTASIQHFLKLASSEPAAWFFQVSGIPFLRDGTIFHLPGISVEVAEECSGIRSSLVLTLTALLTGYLLLRRGWTRVLLVVLSLPLGIARNGFRVFVISWLCVKVDPSMINSSLHRRGGPVFFVLSLIPLFLVAQFLRRHEARAASRKTTLK